MRRIGILAGVLGMSLMGHLASPWHGIVTIDRDRPVSIKRRRVAPAVRIHGRGKYMPHQGAKERERAKRCYMDRFHGTQSRSVSPYYNRRSAPCMMQMSKREYAEIPF